MAEVKGGGPGLQPGGEGGVRGYGFPELHARQDQQEK